MNVRLADERDAAVVASLLGELGHPGSPRVVAARLEETDAVLLAEQGEGLVALHRVPRLAEGGSFARVTALVVAEAHRGQGVARSLLAAAEEVAREWGSSAIEVTAGRRGERAAAHALYRSAGYADTGETKARYWKPL